MRFQLYISIIFLDSMVFTLVNFLFMNYINKVVTYSTATILLNSQTILFFLVW